MQDAASPPLRIAIVGAGQVGSAFAFQLARRGGHEVTVVARPGTSRWRQLRQDGVIVNVKGERATVLVADAIDETLPYDLVLVTLMAHQTEAVLPALRRSVARCIQFMGNTFHPERLQAAVGAERCALGMPFVQAKLDQEGRLNVKIGAGGRKTIMDRQHWVNVFNTAGLLAAVEPQMALWLRCHVPLCVAFESVSAAGMKRGGGASWREALVLARGVHASFKLIQALGYELYPRAKRRTAGTPRAVVAALLWSLSRNRSFRELLATGETECRALVDDMLAAARIAKANVPVSDIQGMKPC